MLERCPLPKVITQNNINEYNNLNVCWFCDTEIIDKTKYNYDFDYGSMQPTCFYVDGEGKSRNKRNLKKSPDFDLFTGLYRGPAHIHCIHKYNLNNIKKVRFDLESKNNKKKRPKFPRFRDIPLYFHNFGGYDSHLILGIIGKEFNIGSIIAKSSEKIISIFVSDMKHSVRFFFKKRRLE